MFELTQARSSQMTISEVLDRLAQNELVDGLLIIGSAGKDRLTPASDYDLVVVLAEKPLPLHVGVTYINHRFTDLIFLTTEQIEQVLTLDAPIAGHDWLGRIIRWLQAGTIHFDRQGRIGQARQKVMHGEWLAMPDETDGYGPWFRVNYNLAQSKRMLVSDDPVYQLAVDLRMALYGPADLLFGYFAIRRLIWQGEKEAVRFLMTRDPAYVDLLRQFIFEADRTRKFELYEELAEITVAPLSAIWRENVSVMGFDSRVGLETIEAASGFWDDLISIPDQSGHPEGERSGTRRLIGLESGVVKLLPYSAEWVRLFEEERALLQTAVGQHVLSIQHVGSTSIPGMPAKPVMDIGIAVASFEGARVCIQPLERLGYEYRGEFGIPRRHYFVKGTPRTHHIHMAEKDSRAWENQVLFRDYLIRHPQLAEEYAALKVDLAQRYSTDREAYLEGKAPFIERVLEMARSDDWSADPRRPLAP